MYNGTIFSYKDIAICEPYTKNINIEYSKSNFLPAFYVLPKNKRIAITNIYTLCSYLDNIVDNTSNQRNEIETKTNRLDWWINKIHNIYIDKIGNDDFLFIKELKEIIKDFSIPEKYFQILINGIKKDLSQRKYNTLENLLDYCFGVASSVGLICIHIFGDTSQTAQNYAVNLGYALQLTNIIRDVETDYKRNYIYLPQEDLKKFSISPDDLQREKYNQNFVNLMEQQYRYAINYYNLAQKYYQELSKKAQKQFNAAEIMKNIYFELLQKIKNQKFNIFNGKIKLSTAKKLLIISKTIL